MKFKSDTPQDRLEKSIQMKRENARRAQLNETETFVYLNKLVSLKNVQAFVRNANDAKGFKAAKPRPS